VTPAGAEDDEEEDDDDVDADASEETEFIIPLAEETT